MGNSRIPEGVHGSDEGHTKWYLGVHIDTTADFLKLSQSAYSYQVLEEHGLRDVKEYRTTMVKGLYEELQNNSHDAIVKGDQYTSLIGTIMYLANKTRHLYCSEYPRAVYCKTHSIYL